MLGLDSHGAAVVQVAAVVAVAAMVGWSHGVLLQQLLRRGCADGRPVTVQQDCCKGLGPSCSSGSAESLRRHSCVRMLALCPIYLLDLYAFGMRGLAQFQASSGPLRLASRRPIDRPTSIEPTCGGQVFRPRI